MNLDEENSGPWKSRKGVWHFSDLCVVDKASEEEQEACRSWKLTSALAPLTPFKCLLISPTMYNFLTQTKFWYLLKHNLSLFYNQNILDQQENQMISFHVFRLESSKNLVVISALILTKHQKHPPQPVLAIKVTREISGKLRKQRERKSENQKQEQNTNHVQACNVKKTHYNKSQPLTHSVRS